VTPSLPISNHELVGVREISKLIGLSPETIRRYRYKKLLVENQHWIAINSRLVLYVAPLVKDWFLNRHDPAAHQRAIENYLSQLPSNQKVVRHSKSSNAPRRKLDERKNFN
jgi:hypothetical protein